jgi:hypothetical protein
MDVWGEVAAAEAVWASLQEQGREIHFETDPVTGRLSITERELDGTVLRELSATDALEIAAGDPAALSLG